ncbi:LacI family DNA-binding transcriptional regulator [Primorskyibacter flagellatus]|uniref:DNA-binding transcriptional regulator, LacI/PurR family n=1 Tax=Primorskyibacter flagellatus TaxID=1387277 RepID=A0A1W2DAK3_9RHOB|nr:LacI family DNA-binding transcriptional regulator [Primorskyibacter flagellatus]SMC94539.1 DNA-binding transcriptional regulator, LacI/PurR family [Primorskyibacter flagellatus]
MKKITAKDVAARAGVSVSAVSRAYRADASITEAKRKAIFAAAGELGFVSSVDKVLSQQSTNTIALVVSELHNPFYPGTVDELVRQLPERGLRAIVHVVSSADEVDTIMRQVLDFRTEGVILASSTMTSQLARSCRANGMPAVLLNRVQFDSHMMAVCCDNYGGARQIAKRFLAQGRQRVAFVGGRRDTSTHLERMRGFRDHLEEAGTAIVEQYDGGFDYQQAFRVGQELLARRPLPDAVFCANDIMAIALLDAARIKRVSVPEDIAVIGFDDIPMASWEAYRLTTVRQPLRRMLRQAVDILTSTEATLATGDIRVLQGAMQERESG